MVMDTSRLRAAVFERSGVAIDENDPIMAVLAVSAEQTEEIGRRLLAKTSPVRIAVVTGSIAFVFATIGAWLAWQVSQRHFEQVHAAWLRQQSDPQRIALLASEEGKAAVQLAELGVARILVRCDGRRSWIIRDGYCVPATPDGRPDGFRVSSETTR